MQNQKLNFKLPFLLLLLLLLFKTSIESVQKENDQLKQALVSLKREFDEQIKVRK